MILEKQPLSLAEVKEHIKNLEENKIMNSYLKAFCKISLEDAKKMKQEIQALNNHKIKDEYLVKIIDMLPTDSEELHKIFSDVSLSEDESNAILGVVKNY